LGKAAFFDFANARHSIIIVLLPGFWYSPAYKTFLEDNMAFCASCGQEVGSAGVCPKCGAAPVAGSLAPLSSSEGLAENVAGLLCYLVGWITGVIFLLIDKRPWVRFHAAQSIAVFGGLTIIQIALSFMGSTIGGLLGFGLMGMLGMLIGLVTLVLWILLMVKAYKHETFKVPVAAGIAESIAAK
jgi:uncharacterized membrane protein